MDGYTVDEAAEVLGIPGKHVWELITTGVLAASSEGRSGMRVFLQPRTTTEMESTGSGEPRGWEATPFRELLTEFRNLTERYGQALLALGEARGEVASLRGRVDLLEARIDVRHAPARIAPVGSWPSAPSLDDEEAEAGLDEVSGQAPPAAEQELGLDEVFGEAPSVAEQEVGLEEVSDQALRTAEHMAEADAEEPAPVSPAEDSVAAPSPEEADGQSRRRGRSRSGHATLADIQAALARAEDPTAAELREATAEAAVAESHETAQAAVAEPDGGPPAAVAEPDATAPASVVEPEAEQRAGAQEPSSDDRAGVGDEEPLEAETPLFDAASPYTTAFEEPDWIIEEDLWRSAVHTETTESEEAGDAESRGGLPDADLIAGLPEPRPAGLVEGEAPSTAWSGLDGSAELDAMAASLLDALETEAIAEPSTAEAEGMDEPSTVEPEAEPETSAVAEPDAAQETPAIEAITADVAFSIGEPEPEPEAPPVAEAEPEEEAAEPPGDFDAFMAAADLGYPLSTEPDYAAELEHSTAGWHSVIAPTEAPSDVEDAAESVDEDEPGPEAGETATAEHQAVAPADESDAGTDSWDASEMEAIRALLARANAIDRDQLEVEASSHPLEPDQEESVREIVASGVATDLEGAVEEPPAERPPDLPEGEELILDLASPDAQPPDEPPFSLSPRLELPGSNDLGEAMAALEAMGAEQESEGPPPDPAPTARAAPLWPEAERRAWSGLPDSLTSAPTIEAGPPSGPPTAGGTGEEVLAHLDFGAPEFSPPAMTTGGPEWASRAPPHDEDEEEDEVGHETRDSAASRAFRRFRRIFPG
jgi:hypothetical protein